MPTYFVGSGGNDGNSGLTWALRKLTLNGAEDVPVVAGDAVIVGAGVYREQLIADVDGGAGNHITYIGDVNGNLTDGVGGIVRITGSDNDQTAVRSHCITVDSRGYRTFRGFSLDTTVWEIIDGDASPHHITFEDCFFQHAGAQIIYVQGDLQTDWIVRRCGFIGGSYHSVFLVSGATDNVNHLVENCFFIGALSDAIRFEHTGDCIVRNCTIYAADDDGIDVALAVNAGHPVIVENCLILNCGGNGLEATAVTDMTENFNNFYNNGTDRTNVNVGANSTAYPPLFLPPTLNSGAGQASGFRFPWDFGALSQWSQLAAIAGNNEPATDFHGIRRPATAAKNSWGATQFVDMEAETGTVQAGTYARVLHDAGCILARRIPVTGVQITVGLYVRRETNYAGNLPQMIIKQPGQADQITAMTAAVNTWEELTDTFTPAVLPGFVEVWVESRNTAVALAYEVFYDTMTAVLA